MKLTLTHTLTFDLGTPSRAVQHLLLTAQPTPQQQIERWSIEMPGIAEAATFLDGFGNRAHLVSQVKLEMPIVVTVSGVVETIDRSGVLGRLERDPPVAMFRRASAAAKADPALLEGLQAGSDRIALFHELMGRLHEASSGQTQMQDAGGQRQSQGGSGPVALAHGFIGAARGLGIPARYVTGYLLDDNGKSSLHAWAEGWDDGLGWIGFDPLFNVCPTENHIRLASALDATTSLPIRSVPVWAQMPVETVEISAAE